MFSTSALPHINLQISVEQPVSLVLYSVGDLWHIGGGSRDVFQMLISSKKQNIIVKNPVQHTLLPNLVSLNN